MQRRTMDSCPKSVDLNVGSISSNDMIQQTSWNTMFDSPENHLPNFTLSSDEANFTRTNLVGHDVPSSSSATPHNQGNSDDTKMKHAWSSSLSVRSRTGLRLDERRFEPNNMLLCENSNVGSDCLPHNLIQTDEFEGGRDNKEQDMETGARSNPWVPDTCQISSANFSFNNNVGSSSGFSGSALEENDSISASLGSWGSSCKRKALEGTSSSSCFTRTENSMCHTLLDRPNLSNNSNASTPPLNSRTPGMGEDINDFPPLSITQNSETLLRNFDRRVNSGHQHETPSLYHSSSRRSSGHFTFIPPFPNPSRPQYSESNIMQGSNFSRNGHLFPGSSSGSVHISSDRGLALREDTRLARSTRNHALDPTIETRNLAQDPTNWSLATGNIGSSEHNPWTPPWPSWVPQPNPHTRNDQRLPSGFSPWNLFASADDDTEHGGSSSSSILTPVSTGASASSSQDDTRIARTSSGSSSRHSHRQTHARAAFSRERQGEDVLGMPHSLRGLAADIEGRHRLITEIRQVLGAMRRGENLRAEDYMLFDPLIFHGLPEIHDRHRDMRLDVDNMSYEELLALGERIGDVKTGLNEESIVKIMKQKKYDHISTRNSNNTEPCCVCQEEYVSGDDLGTLDCGHDFHTDCIKRWLTLKNLCPICKTTGLIT